ncbi:MAG TPA: response regulator transcription factor [Candidatus Nitrosocosmicus sp.]|nr:response regulator transcription factor [Candidatus Nitrosocosmicus sp.]
MKILLIGINHKTRSIIREKMKGCFIFDSVLTGEEGEYQAYINFYDLILLNAALPDTDGIEVCKKIRSNNVNIPIIIITKNSEHTNKISAFDAGADEYISGLFNGDEITARIRALMRRQNGMMPSDILIVGDLSFDSSKKIAKRQDKIICLRRKELYLLEYLMRNVGKVITREMILDHIWESSNESMTNIVDVHINYLREQIDKPFNKKLIKTVHGLGYKIEDNLEL